MTVYLLLMSVVLIALTVAWCLHRVLRRARKARPDAAYIGLEVEFFRATIFLIAMAGGITLAAILRLFMHGLS